MYIWQDDTPPTSAESGLDGANRTLMAGGAPPRTHARDPQFIGEVPGHAVTVVTAWSGGA